MIKLFPFFLLFAVLITSFPARAQSDSTSNEESDTSYSNESGLVDSLRLEFKRIESAFDAFKVRTDSTKQLSEADQEELDKLSSSLRMIGDELHGYSEDAGRLASEAAKIYDVENVIKENGDYTLEEDEVSDDNVEVLNGDAFIYGTINGTLIVVNGDAFVRHDAKISGDVIVVNGNAHVSEYTSIEGNVVEREGTDLHERESFVHRLKLSEHPDIWQNHNFHF